MTAATSSTTQAAAAFSRQAPKFDELYGSNAIIAYKRARVRAQVARFLSPGPKQILELNCGTGEDALYFAVQGHQVLATDISEAMLAALKRKAGQTALSGSIEARLCAFHELGTMETDKKFDLVFSNFGGLNCSEQLGSVLRDAGQLLRPGGLMTLVVMPSFCLWESLFLLKGEWRTATRRWFSHSGANAQVEGTSFRCWYYSPVFIRKALAASFSVLRVEGLCTIVPPSYREQFSRRFPRLLRRLQRLEDRLASYWPFRSVGDYFIITLQKKEAD